MKNLKVFVLLFVFVSSIAYVNAINPVSWAEIQAIKALMSDCPAKKKLLGVTYEKVGAQAQAKLPYVNLILNTTSANIVSSLTDAPNKIFASPFFNSLWPTVILVHGFLDDPQATHMVNLGNAIKTTGNVNVLFLDHRPLTSDLDYYLATTNTQYVGEALANCLSNASNTAPPNLVHMIGLSLGAQICAFTGKTYKTLTGNSLGRISALEPAAPCFYGEPTTKRLFKTDATLVDVIHTETSTLGYPDPIGHVDFYPNSGRDMPGCTEIACCHFMSVLYYQESVMNKDAFLGVLCSSWSNFQTSLCKTSTLYAMGYGASASYPPGSYYLKTSGSSPYGLGAKGVNSNLI